MKALFEEILKALGARVAAVSPTELHVKAPGHSPAGRLLETPADQILSFSAENPNPTAMVVAPGSRLVETAAQELAQRGAVRHGILPIRYPVTRKDFKSRYSLFGSTQGKFSCRRGWRTLVRIWLKITLVSDEIVEMLEGIEISADSQPSRIENRVPACMDTKWAAKPRLKFYQLKALMDAGLRLAENLTVEKAADLQRKNFENLYPTIKRLRAYYQGLTTDWAAHDPDKASAIRAEYRRRIREEIQYARVTAKLDLIAVETLATPVQNLRWQLEGNGIFREVTAALNLYDGSVIVPVCCEICGCGTFRFGLAASNAVVCMNCCRSRKGGVIHAEQAIPA